MSAVTAPLLVEFPPPPQSREKQIKFRVKPSIDAILARTAPAAAAAPPPIISIEDGYSFIEETKAELGEQQREVARLQAESMERMRVAKELELLLAARERLLDERERALAAGRTPAAAPAVPASPVTGYDAVTHPSLAQQVAFLREREAFIEASENTLFEKAQQLQEWETRLQQLEHDRAGKA